MSRQSAIERIIEDYFDEFAAYESLAERRIKKMKTFNYLTVTLALLCTLSTCSFFYENHQLVISRAEIVSIKKENSEHIAKLSADCDKVNSKNNETIKDIQKSLARLEKFQVK